MLQIGRIHCQFKLNIYVWLNAIVLPKILCGLSVYGANVSDLTDVQICFRKMSEEALYVGQF